MLGNPFDPMFARPPQVIPQINDPLFGGNAPLPGA
jgi:hypothetical protein